MPMPLPSTATTPQTSDATGAKAKSKKRVREPSSLTAAEGTLRAFSLKVCHAVHTMGTTSYNEVADRLVGEMLGFERLNRTPAEEGGDERNIRRCATFAHGHPPPPWLLCRHARSLYASLHLPVAHSP